MAIPLEVEENLASRIEQTITDCQWLLRSTRYCKSYSEGDGETRPYNSDHIRATLILLQTALRTLENK
jgi:hypothetical protein